MRGIRKTDVILAVLLLAVAGLFYGRIAAGRHSSGVAVVSVNGEEIGRYDLLQDQRIPVKIKGKTVNQIVIRGGEVFMDKASCPDQLCVKMGKKHLSGESIVCLPNRVVVSVEEGKSELDTVAR